MKNSLQSMKPDKFYHQCGCLFKKNVLIIMQLKILLNFYQEKFRKSSMKWYHKNKLLIDFNMYQFKGYFYLK
jgi:hypothetical protein